MYIKCPQPPLTELRVLYLLGDPSRADEDARACHCANNHSNGVWQGDVSADAHRAAGRPGPGPARLLGQLPGRLPGCMPGRIVPGHHSGAAQEGGALSIHRCRSWLSVRLRLINIQVGCPVIYMRGCVLCARVYVCVDV